MKRTTKMGLTAALVPGMALLGATTGLMLLVMPALTGMAAALLTLACLTLSAASGALGAIAYGAGMALTLWIFEPSSTPMAGWMTAFLLLAALLSTVQVRRKIAPAKAMAQTGAALFCFGAVSYIVTTLALGSLVDWVIGYLKDEFLTMERDFTQLYDLMLSMLSSSGVLSDVGLSYPVAQLDAQTRNVLTASLLELYESSLRLGLMRMLAEQSIHAAFLSVLVPLYVLRRAGRDRELSKLPPLHEAQIPRGPARWMMIMVIAAWVWMLFDRSAYAGYLALWSVFKFIYAIQGLSVAEFYMRKWGWARVPRGLVLCAGYLFLQELLFLLGFAEHIFRFRGLNRDETDALHNTNEDDDYK